MAVSYDKNRKKYVSRVNYKGKRYFVGRFKFKTDAIAADVAAKSRIEKLNTYSLENYEMKFEKPRRTNFLTALRQWRKERKRDKETARKMESM